MSMVIPDELMLNGRCLLKTNVSETSLPTNTRETTTYSINRRKWAHLVTNLNETSAIPNEPTWNVWRSMNRRQTGAIPDERTRKGAPFLMKTSQTGAIPTNRNDERKRRLSLWTTWNGCHYDEQTPNGRKFWWTTWKRALFLMNWHEMGAIPDETELNGRHSNEQTRKQRLSWWTHAKRAPFMTKRSEKPTW